MEFKLPDLGENIESGDVVALLVQVGDRVESQQPVLELETDKAVIEVPVSRGGVVQEIHVQPGDKAGVGELILTLEADEEKGSPADKPAATPEEAPEETPAQVEDSDSDVSEETKTRSDENDAGAKSEAQPATSASPDQSAAVVAFSSRSAAATAADVSRLIPASPAIRRMARELGVDIAKVSGTGPRNRITKEDLEKAAQGRESGTPALNVPSGAALPDFSRWGEIETKPFTKVRSVTAQRLAHNWLTIPHVTQHDECDVTELEKRRNQFSSKVEAAGAKLTVTAIIIRMVASALKLYPDFNASIDSQGQQIIFKKSIHIGVAVDTPRGLLVPVIRDADQKNIIDVAVELQEVAARAQDGKIDPDRLQGGTFTVTNLGGIGGTSFTPIVNWPEVAILGVSRSAVRPVFRDGTFVPRTMLPLSLSYDHRLIDGARAARFLRWVCQSLEDPFLSILEG